MLPFQLFSAVQSCSVTLPAQFIAFLPVTWQSVSSVSILAYVPSPIYGQYREIADWILPLLASSVIYRYNHLMTSLPQAGWPQNFLLIAISGLNNQTSKIALQVVARRGIYIS